MHASRIVAALAFGLRFAQAGFQFSNVKIGGGGGFVPGIVFSPSSKGVAYARTDIGGLYRLNSDDSWTALTDGITQSASWHNWGSDALAVDPQNPKAVYAAVGMYTNSWDASNGAIIRSSDSGTTWAITNLTFKVGGNMPGRGMGERLAVDPRNSKIIYFGARSGNGLWRSVDQGVSFQKVASFTAVGTYVADSTDTTGYQNDIQGLAWITFDSTSATLNGATSDIYVGVADVNNSVYVSKDAGSTWSAVVGQPKGYLPHKCKLQPTEKALYFTYSNTSGPYDGGTGSVNRLDLVTGVWKDITPVTGSNLYFGFGGLGVDMLKPGTLVVASLNSWYPDAQLFRSTDSGTTWSPIWEWTSYPNQNDYYSYSTPNAPWIKNSIAATDTKRLGWMIESLEIDPFDSDHWLYGTGLTIYGGHDLTKWDTTHNVTIQSLANGIEETAVLDLKSVPGGPALLVAIGDDGGFTFSSSLNTSPNIEWTNPLIATNEGVDYAGNKPASVVRAGNTNDGTQQVAVSTNGGQTWSIDYGSAGGQYGGKVAYSADADSILWSSTTGVLVSQFTNAFTAVTSLPNNAAIAADRRNGTVFYGGSTAFYLSTDTGKTFSKTTSLGSATTVRGIAANPTLAGDVWVSTDAGVFHSTNYGISFTQASTAVTNTYSIALGKGTAPYWNIYVFGSGPSGDVLYASADSGASWTDIQGSQGFGAISGNPLSASADTAGLVFVGTNGRGVFYGQGSLTGGSAGPTHTTTSSSNIPSTVSSTKASTSSAETSIVKSTTLFTQSMVQSTIVATTAKISTTASVKATSTVAATSCAARYGQCGGMGWNGPICCASGSVCTASNTYYSQCL
ncbi:Xyloglucanase [Agyrium rufum]|nr:Xyloglucanase [Agyrium rufum]